MIRIKDPEKTIGFYRLLGMRVIEQLKNPDRNFDLYFLGYDSPKALSHGNHWTDRQGLLELTHNYGSENDPSFKVNNGNEEPNRGFGHVCVTVDHIQAVCRNLEDAGYKFQKKVCYCHSCYCGWMADCILPLARGRTYEACCFCFR